MMINKRSSQIFQNIQVKSNPITGLDRPRGFQEFEAPIFQYNRHMKVIRLSALRTDSLYLPGNNLCNFVYT